MSEAEQRGRDHQSRPAAGELFDPPKQDSPEQQLLHEARKDRSVNEGKHEAGEVTASSDPIDAEDSRNADDRAEQGDTDRNALAEIRKRSTKREVIARPLTEANDEEL